MKKLYILVLCSIFWACENFIEIDLPDNQLTKDLVFEDVQTADAVLTQVYYQLFSENVVTGANAGVGYLLATYSDELDYYSTVNTIYSEFYLNQLQANTSAIAVFWDRAYNSVFSLNSVVQGVSQSQRISGADKERLLGEAYFTRAYIHYFLQGLFEKVPYVQTTDYEVNKKIGKLDVSDFYLLLEKDLEKAYDLLGNIPQHILKGRPSKDAVRVLQARVALRQQKWAQVITFTNDIILSNYHLELDLANTFLKESPETIWQLLAKSGNNAMEGATYVFEDIPPSHFMNQNLYNSFEIDDLRKTHWTRTINNGSDSYSHFYKYKENQSSATSKEYSIQFRLAEVYLMRAEAYLQSDQVDLGMQDINKIRTRANLSELQAIDADQAMEYLEMERRHELFGEHGHRFFDLKRWGLLDQRLSIEKSNWKTHYKNWPLPEKELLLNPNLKPQNDEY